MTILILRLFEIAVFILNIIIIIVGVSSDNLHFWFARRYDLQIFAYFHFHMAHKHHTWQDDDLKQNISYYHGRSRDITFKTF